ncbi:MAG: hypothetical protein LBU32_02415 [Clostridiales bacterium]|jgi:hypothetical protein|nr:hypothetical protein [Clostridiales bacterium]
MEYDFTKRERDFGRIVFALTLDRKKMTERVIVGRNTEVSLRFERGIGEVYYDETRPLGSLLIGLEADPTRQWNVNAAILRDSCGKVFPFDAQRWMQSAPVADYLAQKYESGEPSAMFAAIRTWEEYLNFFNLNHGADLITERLAALYRPFVLYAENRPWQELAQDAMSAALRDTDTEVSLWYPAKKRPFEVVAAFSSLLPVIQYCLFKLDEWGFVFQQCKICGKDFVAKSRHCELCGDECRRVQAALNKREFDGRAKGDKLEQLHENAYNYWYNRLRKLKKGKTADPERVAAVGAAFKEYRKEAVKRKTSVKNGEMSFSDFATWLAEQQNAVDALMSETDPDPKVGLTSKSR